MVDSGWVNESFIPVNTYNTQNWHHVVFTVHNEITEFGPTERNTIYFNGVKISDYNTSNVSSFNDSNEATQLFSEMAILLGGMGDGNNIVSGAGNASYARDSFNGKMYDVRIYDKKLSADEALNIYQNYNDNAGN